MPKQLRQLWLIGGTRESVELGEAIASLNLFCLVTVTTATAELLYPKTPTLQIQVGPLDRKQVQALCQQQSISAILDASHPYAVEISQIAIATAQDFHIPYLRFERPRIVVGQGDKENQETQDDTQDSDESVITLDSFDSLVAGDYLNQQRVLLTVGYKALWLFQNWQQRSTLFTRILPTVKSLEAAIEAGFSRDRIIALRPPVPFELEIALWRHWHISQVVTKASGVPGGELTKRKVAAKLGIPLIVIERPVIQYPQQTSDMAVALAFCQKYSHGNNLAYF